VALVGDLVAARRVGNDRKRPGRFADFQAVPGRRRILLITATPEVLGSCDGGSWSAGFGAADRQAGGVRAVDRQRDVEPAGVPVGGDQPANGEALATRAHGHSSSGRRLHYPPVINAPVREISSRFLSEDERVAIADLHRRGLGVRAIAAEVGRSPGTISRELRRNLDPGSGQYRPFTAQRMAAARRARPGRGKLAGDAELAGFVRHHLRRRWSPEQICRALRARFPGQPSRHLVPETIYQAVYRPGSTLRRELPPRVLRTGRSRRRPRRHPQARCGRLVGMTMIDQRPAEVNARTIPGHWEGDLITGASNRSAIGTLVERTSRFTILLHLPADHGAQAVRDAVIAALAGLPASLRRSLTWDQGSEMALHAQISQALGVPVFFCERPARGSGPATRTPTGGMINWSKQFRWPGGR